MNQTQIIMWIIKLVLGGIAAFLAILLWSKTRSASWMSLVAGVIVSYAGIIYEMLIALGIFSADIVMLFGLPVVSLCFTVIPYVFLITALILIIKDIS